MRDGDPAQESPSGDDDGGRETERVRLLPVIGGVFLGWFLCWVVFVLVFLFGYGSLGDSGWSRHGLWIGGLGLLAVPLTCLGLLGYEAFHRQAKAGVLLGMTIGSVVGAGVCSGAYALG